MFSIMKLVIFLYMLIIFLPAAFAETKIFSDNVLTGADKVIDGGTFRFTYDEQSNKVFVQTPAGDLIVDNGACKPNAVFRVCINRANFSHKNITTYVYYYEVNADIYKLTGSLSAAGKAALSTLLQGEATDVTVTVANPTDFEITGISFSYVIANFTIKEVKGCTLDGNKITWQGSLQPKFDKTCTATIIAEKDGKYSLAGNLSYFNGYEKEQKNTDPLIITVLPGQLKATYFIDDNIELNKPFYFNVSLQNIHKDEKIDLSATIEVPSHVSILKHTAELNKDFNVLKRSLILEPGSFFNYSLYLEATAERENPLKHKFNYAIKGIISTIENYTFIKSPEPNLEVNLSSEYAEVIPGQKFIVVAKLTNPSKFHKFTGIKAKLGIPNGSIEQSLGELMPGKDYAIISNTLTAPSDASPIKLSLSIEYSFEGKTRQLSKSIEIKVNQTSVSTTTIKDTAQAVQPANNESAAAEKQLINETVQPVATEKPKSSSNKLVLFGSIAIAVFLVVLLIINRARKGKRRYGDEKEALKEIQEKILKVDWKKPKTKDF